MNQPVLRRAPRALLAALAVIVLAAPRASATSYVPMSDDALLDQSPVAVEAFIQGVEMAPGLPATDYRARVVRVLKGSRVPAELTIRVPGGQGPDGLHLEVFGAPRFGPGDRTLLFLEERADGAWAPVHLMLGAFREVPAGGRRLAVRDLSEARAVALPGRPAMPEGQRDFDRFADWIAARALGERRALTDYFVAVDERLIAAFQPFTLITSSDGLTPRWFEFDSGGALNWRLHSSGFPALPGTVGTTALQAALGAWTSDSATLVDYRYAGTTTANKGFTASDGVNTVLPGDPNNEIAGSYDCQNGGVLAIGGPWSQGTKTFRGKTWRITREADVIAQNGIDCFLAAIAPPPGAAAGAAQSVYKANASGAAELLAHELGHTLGLGHSCGDNRTPACSTNAAFDDAVMRATVHNDGRGASLRSDDRAGLADLYAPAAPLVPCVDGAGAIRISDLPGDNRFRVCVRYSAQGGTVAGPGNPIGLGSLGVNRGIVVSFFGADNPEVLLKILNGCPLNSKYWVFVSAGTNVGVTLTIVDTVTGATKTILNVEGTAFPTVQDTSALPCS